MFDCRLAVWALSSCRSVQCLFIPEFVAVTVAMFEMGLTFDVGAQLCKKMLLNISDGVVLHLSAVPKPEGDTDRSINTIGGVFHPVLIGGAVSGPIDGVG